MPKKPEWDEKDKPSQSVVNEGVATPMAFGEFKRGEVETNLANLEAGVLAADPAILGQAITLIESALPAHRSSARKLLEQLYPVAQSKTTLRVGITGVPGVGKSTFIEAMGLRLVRGGHRLAVLTVDPSSEISGGSILGDKTRMEGLSRERNAFIRPSPSRGVLGGVARWTREAMVVLEAAGFDTIFIETVGVGQSEVLVRSMVDAFLLLTIAGAGDELQGIKKGIVELADLLAVTKSDGDNIPRAKAAAEQLRRVVHYLPQITPGWTPSVSTVSSTEGAGLDELWGEVEKFVAFTRGSGSWQARREAQQTQWLMSLISEGILDRVRHHPDRDKWLRSASSELPTALAEEIIKRLVK
jgi:LAO/AO transport system kinase